MRSPYRRPLAWAVALALTWLVGYPLLLTLLEALGAPLDLTLEHFAAFAGRADEWQALWRSLWISAASVGLAALVGVPLAFVFARLEFPGRRLLGGLIALPVALPPLVGVIAFLFLYGESGFLSRGVQAALGLETPPWRLQGAGAILLVHAYSMYVYFYLFVRAGLARLDAAMEEAAAILGAGRRRTLLRVTLPLLLPALVGASLLTFMTSLASFSAPYIFGGGFRVMTTQIVASKLNGEIAMAQVETVTLALLAFAGLWAMRRVDPGKRVVVGGVRGTAPRRRELERPAARFGAAALGWGLTLVMLLPHLTLILISFVPPATWTVEALPPVLDGGNYQTVIDAIGLLWLGFALVAVLFLIAFWVAVRWLTRVRGVSLAVSALVALLPLALLASAAVAGLLSLLPVDNPFALPAQHPLRPVLNSIWMALAATVGAVALGLTAADLSVKLRGRLGAALETLLAVPWAVPGTVFAIALASAFSTQQPLAGRFLLVGTVWILPLAYLVRSLPLTGRSALAGLRQLDPAMAEAAASLGAGRWRTFWRVRFPLLRPALLAGAGLAFITALGDFVTSIILYTYDNRPISMEILSNLRLQDTGVAAVYGVLLMVLSAAAFVGRGGEEAL